MKTLRFFLSMLILVVFAGCSKENCNSCKSPTAPTECTVTLTTNSTVFENTGGTGTAKALASAGCVLCSEPASSSDPTILIVSGENNGEINFTVLSGTNTSDQTVRITKCGKSVTVTRKAKPTQACSFTAIPPSGTFKSCKAGEELEFAINNPNNCPVHPEFVDPSDSQFFEIVQCGGTCNSVRVRAKVDNNTNSLRKAKVKISDDCVIPIEQPNCPTTPISCNFTVSPTPLHFSCPGESKIVTVTTNKSDCAWFAMSSMPGVTVTRSGEWILGSGTVTVTADHNGTSGRNDNIVIAGQSVQVSQDACAVITPPTSCTRSATVTIPVTETYSCPNGSVQTATVTVTGNGTVSNVSCDDAQTQANAAAQTDANSKLPAAHDQARAAAQAKCPAVQCTFIVQNTPLHYSYNSTDNTGVVVSTQAGCDWSISSANWVILNRTSGTGSGDFKVSSTQNDGAARNTVINFVGEGGYTTTIPVNQDAKPATACTFSVQNTQLNYSYNPTDNSGVVVSTQPGCSWSVAASASWVILDRSNGIGPGDFKVGAAGNGGGERNANVIFNGQGGFTTTIPVHQGAKP